MSWKGAIRSANAAAKRADRAQKKRQRELATQIKNAEKLAGAQRVALEVAKHENYIDVLTSIHKECGEVFNWEKISKSGPPNEPKKLTFEEKTAQTNLENYEPSFMDKLFRRSEEKISELERKLETAKRHDAESYNRKSREYKNNLEDWETAVDVARRIISGDVDAYLEAVKEIKPFNELDLLGAKLSIEAHTQKTIEVEFEVRGEKVVPDQNKIQLKSGKLSVKNMTKTRYYEVYQDYVCGASLRIAREIFALLPVDSVHVTANASLLNKKNGQFEDSPILSVFYPRNVFGTLNFQLLDPSDSMSNFIHNMKFKKTQGFEPVDKLDLSKLDI